MVKNKLKNAINSFVAVGVLWEIARLALAHVSSSYGAMVSSVSKRRIRKGELTLKLTIFEKK